MNRDVIISFIWSLVMLFVVLITDNVVIRAVIATPLALFLNGYVVLGIIGLTVRPLEYVVYAVGTSIAVCVVGGFVLNWLACLTPIGWAIWFIMVIGGSALITRSTPNLLPTKLPNLSQWHRWHFACIVGAVLITSGAYLLAVHDEANQREFLYTDFWMLSKPGKLLIGVKSGEATTQQFDIEVTDGAHLVAQWNAIAISPGDTWVKDVDLSPGMGYKAEAKLYRSADHVIYRKVSAVISGNVE